MNKKEQHHTNDLIHETSPYLLQHAHNPVNWQAWKDEVLEQANDDDKLLLISVGYSACHWCHVMEHESFEDEEVAEIMNSNYTCIKVDREERPDVDQVYMNAVQIMTGMGGWPMNVVALPDGRPVWGGTYFKKDQWKEALTQIAKLYRTNREKMYEYAGKLEEGLSQAQIIKPNEEDDEIHKDFFLPVIEKWKRSIDLRNGGNKSAPKFMLPNNYEFLLRYAFQTSDKDLKNYSLHTLDKISWGGVYDPVGGGFSRYSVDERWHVPHFEKMLYDNAQLVELYSKAYRLTKNPWYKEVVEDSLKFIRREMTDKSGAFYSALDADSEEKSAKKSEGAYYIWTKQELSEIIEDDYELFKSFYNINSYGKWEEDKYVLIRTESLESIAIKHNISLKDLNNKKKNWNNKLFIERNKRQRPGLDNKSLTSWNAMMISGYTEAYNSFGKEEYLQVAIKNAEFICSKQLRDNHSLFHSYKNGKSSINAYLEDYAFCIKAFLDLYRSSFDKSYLKLAQNLIDKVQTEFYDEKSGLFFFTSIKDRPLITKTIEYNDNVIPASNSVMARNLLRLGKLTGKMELVKQAKKMLTSIMDRIPEYPQGFSNWLMLLMDFSFPHYEIAVTGKNYKEIISFFNEHYLPNTVMAASAGPDNLFLLDKRYKKDEDLIYICQEGNCQLPQHSKTDALALVEQV
ncbi:thioredoxin domain-containing protein [Christiangramia salexigens]|uniref:Thioredoxin domain-containing protein n=1 Tax=Christiangramia salexigens TaxID=1913577 RepID=A0A1L3J5G5_9FLAO|nr:thioredoxin domain-containing protein [Christiangramia salexigens]APG60377.1 thioredoxin domain-containing protein [Christiangramia salexigens]